ncbi:uncharacterized protein [Primulina huaijiensis]|uniref:uncharacterized protein isoform X2 n=1 Tax=Primulina huaijiensis TaxID=1492673 RepID=UPI003CC792A3
MAESGKDVKAPNVFERLKEEMEAVFQSDKHHHKETHGLNYGIDENTSMSDVKAPNVFERAKEEFEALAEAIHAKKGLRSQHSSLNDETRHCDADDDSKCQVVELRLEKSKEDIESLKHAEKSAHHHHKETHGRSDDIDENIPISQVKGPNVFERAKEEIEALIQTIRPKRDAGNVVSSSTKEGGLPITSGRGLEKLYSPQSRNKDE